MTESFDIKSNSCITDSNSNTKENKKRYIDIICTSNTTYLPTLLLGNIKEIYIKTIDYMVGMNDFEEVFNKLEINDSYINRTNKIYDVLNKKVLTGMNMLSDDDINSIGDYTNRVESSWLYTTVGFDWYVMKHQQQGHIQSMLEDIEHGVLHKFIKLSYGKSNLKIHLFPYACLKEKDISYSNALSYCISIMWATLICIVNAKAKDLNIIDLLKQVFHDLNPIATKMVFCSHRTLTPTGYSFIQELSQLTSADKFIDIKIPPNRVIIRWSPRSDRFENYIYKCFRKETNGWDDTVPPNVRGDSNGKRCLIYDCRIDKSLLTTEITIVGQNIMRDVTGYYTVPIYGLLCDDEQLEHYELASLFCVLTGTREHNELFRSELMKSYMEVKSGKVKFLCDNNFEKNEDIQDLFDGQYFEGNEVLIPTIKEKTNKPKLLVSLSDIMLRGEIKDYTPNMVGLAAERLKEKIFLDLELNNDYYIATQLIDKFNMKRSVPKDIMTVLKYADLPENEFETKLKLVERHKRDKIKEKVEFVKTLEPPKHILHELYNYLWIERYV